MKINRQELISEYNPIKTSIDVTSPLSVGNGEFAFTCDVTGLQTLYQLQCDNKVPLCTMSQWGWHTTPNSGGGSYTLEDLVMTEYDAGYTTVRYPVEKKAGNEAVYDWLRQNPHRLNLGRFYFEYGGQAIKPEQISDIRQTLRLYTGSIQSGFTIDHTRVNVETLCHAEKDALGFRIVSGALAGQKLVFKMSFPYGHHDITASDWGCDGTHVTRVHKISETDFLIERRLDGDAYFISLHTAQPVSIVQTGHTLTFDCAQPVLELTVHFTQESNFEALPYSETEKSSIAGLRDFWENGAMIDLRSSKDKSAQELQRRIILSLYLIYIQSCGSMPPQETGLTCNSWYGKFHLEMHPLHQAFLPLWSRGRYLLKSIAWYKKVLARAQENAARNGYKGARWPKMTAYDAIDAPSVIAPLLIWQQPHILYMLELLYTEFNTPDFLSEYWGLVSETADFMCDFPVFDEAAGTYKLCPPIIPAQEEHRPMDTLNPVFELAYWYFGLTIAARWARRLGKPEARYLSVRDKLAPLPVIKGCYPAHENCADTFTSFNKDHPSMLFICGFLPGDRTDPEVMLNTYKKVLESWQFETMWGWDFALMAMTMVRLGKPEEALSILLKDTAKNTYVTSGNNYQKLRTDLPLYLPGNGSLLLAIALMAAGYKDAPKEYPGFPEDGSYTIIIEDFKAFPF
jgi:protein-glucosylgalactosylhydroxylysine glucosidase